MTEKIYKSRNNRRVLVYKWAVEYSKKKSKERKNSTLTSKQPLDQNSKDS